MVICLERGADLHMAQLMLLPLTVSCFSKIQIGFTFLVPDHLGSPGKRAVKHVCSIVKVSQSCCCWMHHFYLMMHYDFAGLGWICKGLDGEWTERQMEDMKRRKLCLFAPS